MSVIRDDGQDGYGIILGTGYRRFTSSTGICGLYRRNGSRLDLLAVSATREGRGEFRNFMRQAQAEFTTICVWFVGTPILDGALERYGFKPETEVDGSGEILNGYRWDK